MKLPILFVLLLFTFDLFAQNNTVMQKKYYYCPDCNAKCDALRFEEPGFCPQCGMKLLSRSSDEVAAEKPKQFSVCFYLQDGVEVLDFAGPMEVFSLAGFKVFTVSKTGKAVVAQGILKVVPDYGINNAPEADMIAFFGGNPIAFRDRELIAWIKKYEKNTQYVFTVCSGTFALGNANLLKGLTVTTFHGRIAELQTAFPNANVVAGVRFVDNGRFITTAGISAGIDGALHWVARISGAGAAHSVAKEMEYDKWIPNEGLIIEHKN